MILCGGTAIILAMGMFVLHKREKWKKVRNPCRILLAFCILGFLSGILEYSELESKEQGWIRRNDPGYGELETEMSVYVEEEAAEYPITLIIPEKTFSSAEEKEQIAAAKSEIAKTFCGKNPSLDAITENPVVNSRYQDGFVEALWEFSDESCISYEGMIDQNALGDQKKHVEAAVELRCGNSREMYQFDFWIIPQERSRKEQIISDIEDQITSQETTEEKIKLPTYADGSRIRWKKVKSGQPLELLILGILAAVTAGYWQKEQEEKQIRKKRHELLLEYPEFVSKLSLLLGAGMTISTAFRKMNQRYQREKDAGRMREHPVYEELYRMICEIDNGMGELRAYQEFSERCDLQPYRKLISLLLSGQKTGNRKLMERLNEEADRVFSERKNTAKKLGEEAGTKLLLPMMMMLLIVMGIVMIPAFLSITAM